MDRDYMPSFNRNEHPYLGSSKYYADKETKEPTFPFDESIPAAILPSSDDSVLKSTGLLIPGRTLKSQ